MKPIILVDMDGVLVQEPSKEHEEIKRKKMGRKGKKDGTEEHQIHWSDIPEIFLDLKPMDGAIDSYNKLSQDYELYVVSTAPWDNPSAWTDKRKWIEKYLPIATKRLFLTHNKNMIIGDYLIDDRLKNGVDKFKGVHIHFGQEPFNNWNQVLDYFDKLK
jgi:5'-nucleotidase